MSSPELEELLACPEQQRVSLCRWLWWCPKASAAAAAMVAVAVAVAAHPGKLWLSLEAYYACLYTTTSVYHFL